jgi:hypothetical protein
MYRAYCFESLHTYVKSALRILNPGNDDLCSLTRLCNF